MKIKFSLIVLAALGLATLPSRAQAPAGSTGLCKDGTYTTAAKKRGSCDGHGGVKAWFGAPIPQAATPAPAVSAPTSQPQPQVVAQPQTVTPAAVAAAPPKPAPTGAAAIKVWVNLSSKVYHCSDSEWYGKTQNGKFMTQADAVALGARPAYSKACTK